MSEIWSEYFYKILKENIKGERSRIGCNDNISEPTKREFKEIITNIRNNVNWSRNGRINEKGGVCELLLIIWREE